jgi:hypothetical protein
MERLDALTVRESNGKSYFTRIGVAFPSKNGPGYTVMLDAVPASVDGQYKIMLVVPKPKDGEQRNARRDTVPASQFDDVDDRPF